MFNFLSIDVKDEDNSIEKFMDLKFSIDYKKSYCYDNKTILEMLDIITSLIPTEIIKKNYRKCIFNKIMNYFY